MIIAAMPTSAMMMRRVLAFFTAFAFHAHGIQDRTRGRGGVVCYLYCLYIVFDCWVKIGGWNWKGYMIKRSFIDSYETRKNSRRVICYIFC